MVSGTVAGDGTLVLKLYYSRKSYKVTYSYASNVPGQTELPTEVTYKYGAEVTVAAKASAPGYTFSGWTTGDATVNDGKFTMPAKDVVLTGSWTANSNTAYKVEYYFENLAGTEYVKDGSQTQTRTGTTGTEVRAF